MERDLRAFAGRLPYASELYGVHQPLLGWKSRLSQRRIVQSLQLPSFPRKLITLPMVGDGPFIEFRKDGDKPKGIGTIRDGRIYKIDDDALDLFQDNPAILRFMTPKYLDGLIVRSLQADARDHLSAHGRDDREAWAAFWRQVLDQKALNNRFRQIVHQVEGYPFRAHPYADVPDTPVHRYIAEIFARLDQPQAVYEYIFNRELYVVRYLNGLLPVDGVDDPDNLSFVDKLNDLLLREPDQMTLEATLKALDPMALTIGRAREAVLTPIGILHVFRQYFFEFDNFLGPAVEHLWLAPGATTELVEVSTRRVLIEETLERSLERVLTSETTTTNEDELSEALKTENLRDTKLGASMTAGGTILIAHGEASASMSIEETQRVAREENHRTKRQQSSKLASEIRSNVKSTFRTVTETTDARSRRYVIENKTGADGQPPRLVNYELRRKMRQVGVQTQDVGTQLCWQVFVDDPGRELGLGQLVHLAAKSDLSKYDTQPAKNVPAPATESLTILVPVPKPGQTSTLGPIAASGFLGLMANGVPGVAAGVAVYEVLDSLFGDDEEEKEIYPIKPDSIIRQEYKINLPKGYVIADAGGQTTEDVSFTKVDAGEIPLRHISNGKDLVARMQITNKSDGTLLMVVQSGEVTAGEVLEFQAKVKIAPTQAAIDAVGEENKAINQENAQKTQEKARKIKEDFISNVRDRVKLASQVKARPTADLREEERTVIYRALISQLMREAWSLTVDRKIAHLRSEFVKSIFDVDRMFYAVAPEWWQPRRRNGGQAVGAEMPRVPQSIAAQSPLSARAVAQDDKISQILGGRAKQAKLGTLGGDDTVGWGGEGRDDNYLITEESEPARLGSSLGWLLQLDGDNLRNAFLNAPWVKAVIPIRPGRELEALEWLEQAEVEGSDGLDEPYAGEDLEAFRNRLPPGEQDRDPTIREVLFMVAADVNDKNRAALTPVDGKLVIGKKEKNIKYLPPERIFEFGFDPLEQGFKPLPQEGEIFDTIDQWVEVLPTDQIAAVEVSYDPKSGRML